MSARQTLWDLYAEWRHLTEAEHDAISVSAWNRISQCQAAKYTLQHRIIEASEALESEMRKVENGRRDQTERELRQLISELILLETRNGELLAVQRQTLEKERQNLDRSSRNLRQVQQSYGGRSQANWQSFS